jgi:osmotically-inducible protein OsmY
MRKSMVLLVLALAGCNPYVAAVGVVSQTYGVATDERSVSGQVGDTEIEAEIKASLLQSPVSGTDSIDVFSRRGVVVLAGVVPPGSRAGAAAVKIARETSGVVRVETFFVPERASKLGDFELQEKIKAAFIADPDVAESQVAIGVYNSNAVLVGVVDSPEQIDRFVDDARGVSGVMSVRSYIQIKR